MAQTVAGIRAHAVGDFSRWRHSQPKVAAQPRNMIPTGMVDWAKLPSNDTDSSAFKPIEARMPAGISAHHCTCLK